MVLPTKKENLYYVTSTTVDKEAYGMANYTVLQIPKEVAREMNSLQIRIDSATFKLYTQYPKGPQNMKDEEAYQKQSLKIFDMKEKYRELLASSKEFTFHGALGIGKPGQVLKEEHLPDKFRQVVVAERQKQRL